MESQEVFASASHLSGSVSNKRYNKLVLMGAREAAYRPGGALRIAVRNRNQHNNNNINTGGQGEGIA